VACTGCDKTRQVGVPWAREESGFTALTERKAIRDLPWGLRKNPSGWTCAQINARHWMPPSSWKARGHGS
jgi:hypothetical protein